MTGPKVFKAKLKPTELNPFEKYEAILKRIRVMEDTDVVQRYRAALDELSEAEKVLKDRARQMALSSIALDSTYFPFRGTLVEVEVQKRYKADTFNADKLMELAPGAEKAGLVVSKVSYSVDEALAEKILDGDELPSGMSSEEAEAFKDALAESFKPGEAMTPAVSIKPAKR